VIKGVTDALNGTTAANWIFAIGVACALLGLLLLAAAVKPRPRRGIEIEASTGVLISKPAVRRLASSAARGVDGVDTVSVTASRKLVTVDVAILPGAPADQVGADVIEAVADRLSALRESPEVRVRTNSIGG
jgi:tetrahydromethanopterin S-methyltransferase subunit C